MEKMWKRLPRPSKAKDNRNSPVSFQGSREDVTQQFTAHAVNQPSYQAP
jgi:hypothetical protein